MTWQKPAPLTCWPQHRPCSQQVRCLLCCVPHLWTDRAICSMQTLATAVTSRNSATSKVLKTVSSSVPIPCTLSSVGLICGHRQPIHACSMDTSEAYR
jgi:hypothetical protein